MLREHEKGNSTSRSVINDTEQMLADSKQKIVVLQVHPICFIVQFPAPDMTNRTAVCRHFRFTGLLPTAPSMPSFDTLD